MPSWYVDRAPDGQYLREDDVPACPRCGDPLTPDWVGDPTVGWCSPCNAWNFEIEPVRAVRGPGGEKEDA